MQKRHNVLSYMRSKTGISKHYGSKVTPRRKSEKPLRIKAAVVAFLDRDENSRVKAGKKSTITRQGEKRQLRLLNDSLQNLHKKFLLEYSGNISYSLFCSLKPFHIRHPTAADRETCQCKIHENLAFKLEKCKQHDLVVSSNIDKNIKLITCNSENKACMYRECNDCKDRLVIAEDDFPEKGSQVWWNTWKVKREERTKVINGETTTTTVSYTAKVKEFGTLRILGQELQKDIQKATRHIFNIRHQYKTLRMLKEGLTHEEIMIHIDFSENYLCKYAQEIQSMHFGASQRQISLHTGVAYTADRTLSFCSVSDCLKHNPAAIWAHLQPVVKDLKKETGACRIHFVSDGPTTQYRNKQNFYMFCFKLYEYGFTSGTWNFLEAAHGKGAPDGIGAVVKRTADKSVDHGNDITNASDMIKLLQSDTNLSVYPISEADIANMESQIPQNLNALPKTMQIHQVTTSNRGVVKHRPLSCFCSRQCVCYDLQSSSFICQEKGQSGLGGVAVTESEVTSSAAVTEVTPSASVPEVTPSAPLTEVPSSAAITEVTPSTAVTEVPSSAAVTEVTPLAAVTEVTLRPAVESEKYGLLKIDVVDESLKTKHCVVAYDGIPYPGIILDVDEDEELEVSVMHKIGKNRYFWPGMEDTLWYPKDQIVTLLNEPPKPVTKRHHEICPQIWLLIAKEMNLD